MEIQGAHQGLQQTLQQLHLSVQRQQSPQGDWVRETTEQQQLVRQGQAQVKAIQAQDEMLGNLFDAFA